MISLGDRLAIVVIGRNEGPRLEQCIRSVMRCGVRSVYVDSGSTDGSPQIAKQLGCKVLDLDPSRVFSAARARNAGMDWLLCQQASIRYVQFIDGDCELCEGWLEEGKEYLDSNPEVAVVCGSLREHNAERNPYHRLAEMEWQQNAGVIEAPYGVALLRVDSFLEVGGSEEDLVAGEDPELGLRIRRTGKSLVRLDRLMALHDIAMDRFPQWWQRAARGGYAYAAGVCLHGHEAERFCLRQIASILAWSIAPPILGLLLVLAAQGTALAVAGAYVVLWWRIYRHRKRRRNSPSDSALYATFCVVGKFAQLQGIARFVCQQLALRKHTTPIGQNASR